MNTAEAISQAEQLILEFCQELPEEEIIEIEKVNFQKIKDIMNEVGHKEFAQALSDDIEPPSLFDVQFYARFGNQAVLPLLQAGLKSTDADDVEDAVIGLCYLGLEEGLEELKKAIKGNKFQESDPEYLESLFEEVLEEVPEDYKDKMLDIIDS